MYETSCKVSIERFPNDNMTCYLTFESDSFNSSVSFEPLEFNRTRNHELKFGVNSEWSINRGSIKFMKNDLSEFDRNSIPIFFAGIQAEIQLSRKPGYYLVMFVTPICCLQVMMVFVPLLPLESGERLTLACSLSLSFVMFLLLLEGMTPKIIASVTLGILFGFILSVLNVLQSLIAAWKLSKKDLQKVGEAKGATVQAMTRKRRGDFTFFIFNLLCVAALDGFIVVTIIGKVETKMTK